MRIAYALNESSGNAESIGLNRSEVRHIDGVEAGDADGGWQTKLPGGDAAEVVNAAEVDCEVRRERQEIDVGSVFERVLALGEREIVGELVTLFSAANVAERFAAEKRNARHIHGNVVASRRARVVVPQRAPGIIELEF